jgi:hypothetical protein
MMRLPPPRAILFDWDNTLVDAWGTIQLALNAALTAMGQSAWTMEETRVRVRASLRDSFPRMFGDRWPEARDIFYATHLTCGYRPPDPPFVLNGHRTHLPGSTSPMAARCCASHARASPVRARRMVSDTRSSCCLMFRSVESDGESHRRCVAISMTVTAITRCASAGP